MPETRGVGRPPGADALTIEHERRTQGLMQSPVVGRLSPRRDAAEVIASDQRYARFIRWVSPTQWMVSANRESLTVEQIVDAILRDGMDPQLRRAMPNLAPEQWRAKVIACLRQYVEDEVEDEEEVREPRQQPYAYDPPARAQGAPAREGHVVGPKAHEPSEKAATNWSKEHDLNRHRPDRPSQTPEGRRERYIRGKAEREHITYAEAEARTPRRNRS